MLLPYAMATRCCRHAILRSLLFRCRRCHYKAPMLKAIRCRHAILMMALRYAMPPLLITPPCLFSAIAAAAAFLLIGFRVYACRHYFTLRCRFFLSPLRRARCDAMRGAMAKMFARLRERKRASEASRYERRAIRAARDARGSETHAFIC